MILRDRAHAAAVLAARPGTHVAGNQWKDRPMPRPVDPAHVANTAAVALDLADAIAELPYGTDPETVAKLTDRAWALAARKAGCADDYVPSEATRRTVVRLLERRQAAAGTDPFAGFPT